MSAVLWVGGYTAVAGTGLMAAHGYRAYHRAAGTWMPANDLDWCFAVVFASAGWPITLVVASVFATCRVAMVPFARAGAKKRKRLRAEEERHRILGASPEELARELLQ